MFLNPASSLQLVWSPTLNRGPEGSLCWVLAFPTTSCHQLVWFPNCTELYNSSTSTQSPSTTDIRNMHFRRLWNGMFDRHRAEITVMQYTGHSLPVHQFVTVPWDFNPVPYCQPSSPTPMEYALPPSLEWHVWPGRRSIYDSSLEDHPGAMDDEDRWKESKRNLCHHYDLMMIFH